MIYDFPVIGGGIAGASTAFDLPELGNVQLLEAERGSGFHATGRSVAIFTRHYSGRIVREVNAVNAGFSQAPPVGYYNARPLRLRGSLTINSRGHEGTLNVLLTMSDLGEEICPIDPKDACEMVPFPRPVRVARALAALTADLYTAV